MSNLKNQITNIPRQIINLISLEFNLSVLVFFFNFDKSCKTFFLFITSVFGAKLVAQLCDVPRECTI